MISTKSVVKSMVNVRLEEYGKSAESIRNWSRALYRGEKSLKMMKMILQMTRNLQAKFEADPILKFYGRRGKIISAFQEAKLSIAYAIKHQGRSDNNLPSPDPDVESGDPEKKQEIRQRQVQLNVETVVRQIGWISDALSKDSQSSRQRKPNRYEI